MKRIMMETETGRYAAIAGDLLRFLHTQARQEPWRGVARQATAASPSGVGSGAGSSATAGGVGVPFRWRLETPARGTERARGHGERKAPGRGGSRPRAPAAPIPTGADPPGRTTAPGLHWPDRWRFWRLRGEASPPRSQVAAPIPSSSPHLHSYRGGQNRVPAVPHQPSRGDVGRSTRPALR